MNGGGLVGRPVRLVLLAPGEPGIATLAATTACAMLFGFGAAPDVRVGDPAPEKEEA